MCILEGKILKMMAHAAFKNLGAMTLCVLALFVTKVSSSEPFAKNSPALQTKSTQESHHSEWGLALENLKLKLDNRFSVIAQIARTLANDAHIHSWVQQGLKTEQETLLLEKLQFFLNTYNLTSVSFADKNSNRYYNHEGFLAVLTPTMAPWYFEYIASGKQDLVSVYHDKNKQRVDIYINYQQQNGNGLSGVASAYNDYADMLSKAYFPSPAALYIVDQIGKVQVRSNMRSNMHSNKGIFEDENIFERYFSGKERLRLNAMLDEKLVEKSTEWIELPKRTRYDKDNVDIDHTMMGVSYLQSIGWYLVVLK